MVLLKMGIMFFCEFVVVYILFGVNIFKCLLLFMFLKWKWFIYGVSCL